MGDTLTLLIIEMNADVLVFHHNYSFSPMFPSSLVFHFDLRLPWVEQDNEDSTHINVCFTNLCSRFWKKFCLNVAHIKCCYGRHWLCGNLQHKMVNTCMTCKPGSDPQNQRQEICFIICNLSFLHSGRNTVQKIGQFSESSNIMFAGFPKYPPNWRQPVRQLYLDSFIFIVFSNTRRT